MYPKIITESDKYKSRDEFEHYSVSKLKMYKECSEKYKLQYVEKNYKYKESTSTLAGTFMHSTLEYLYGVDDETVKTAIDAYYRILIPELKNVGINDSEAILEDLLEYNKDISKLYARASASYVGEDAIRTGKGNVPKVPEMTSTWKEECRRLDLNNRKNRIDQVIQDSKTGLEDVSITDVFTKAFNMARDYYTPVEIVDIMALELPLSKWDRSTNKLINAVPFPGCEIPNVFLSGYIDNICKIKVNGHIYNAVVDYKTSKEEFTPDIVSHNQQLLSYVAGVEKLLDINIEYVGILSFLQKKLIYAPVNRELLEEVLTNYNKIIQATYDKTFIKHVPDSKYSPCLSQFGSHCPFLENCWPAQYNTIHNNQNDSDYLAYLT